MILNRAPSHRRPTAAGIVVAIILVAVCPAAGSPGGVGTSPQRRHLAAADSTATSGAGSIGVAAESSTAKYGVKLDVVEPGSVLRTTEGRTYQLGAEVGYVVRVPDGWLYGTVGSGAVNLLRPDGSAEPLRARDRARRRRRAGDAGWCPPTAGESPGRRGTTVLTGTLTRPASRTT